MVIVLKNDVSENEKKNIKTLLKSKNFKINEVKGDESTILAAVGRLAMDIREVEVLPGVAKVVPISKPYKLASREFKPENTVVGIPLLGDSHRTSYILHERILEHIPSSVDKTGDVIVPEYSLDIGGIGRSAAGNHRDILVSDPFFSHKPCNLPGGKLALLPDIPAVVNADVFRSFFIDSGLSSKKVLLQKSNVLCLSKSGIWPIQKADIIHLAAALRG